MSEILTSTGAKLWNKDDYSDLWLDVFEQIAGTGGNSNFRLIDKAIGRINTALDEYYFKYENDRLYICKDNTESGATTISKLPVSLIQSDGKVASSVDGNTITIDENGIVHGTTIDDAFSLTSENPVQNKVVKAKFDEVDEKIKANETTISSHTTAINTLNGDGEGSVKKTVTDEIAKVVADAPESLDTLKEISDWISGHESDASAMNSAIQTNKSDITTLQTDKVDKETGKSLLADTDKANYEDAVSKAHTHSNKELLDKIGESTEGNLTFNGNEIRAAQMTGATTDIDGTSGTVPAPLQGQEGYVLKGNGNWEENVKTDTEFSKESTNPIANSTTTAKFNEIDTTLSSHTEAISQLNTGLDSLNSNFLTSSKSVYVDATNGNDTTGDGSQENPWATIQKAVDMCPCVGDKYVYSIYLAPGTYDEYVMISNKHQIYIYGATTNVLDDADNYKVKKIEVIGVNYLCIKGIYFYGDDNAYSKSGFAATNCSGDIVYCKFNDCMCSTRDSEMTISESDVSNYRSGSMNYGAIFATGGKINCYNVSGSNNKCAYCASNSGGAGQIFTNASCTLTGDIMFSEGWSGRIHYGVSGYQLIGSVTGANIVAIDSKLYTEFIACIKYGSLQVVIPIPTQVLGANVCGGYYESGSNGMKVGLATSTSVIQLPSTGVSYNSSVVTDTSTMTVYGKRG